MSWRWTCKTSFSCTNSGHRIWSEKARGRRTMHTATGVGERVLVARVALRKHRNRCADGVARRRDKAADYRNVGNASAANPRRAHRRRCTGNRLMATAVIGMRSPPPIHHPAKRKFVSPLCGKRAGPPMERCQFSRCACFPPVRTRLRPASESKLGGFSNRFAVPIAYQTQMQLLSVSHQVRLKAIRFE